MDFAAIQKVLTDLPRTFLRDGAPFSQFIDSETAGLLRFGNAIDGLLNQLIFADATDGWLDVWGLTFGVQRLAGESNSHYQGRIAYTVTAGGGPPAAIARWCKIVFNLDVTVQESFPAVGYSITFLNPVSIAQITQVIQSLVYIRPAGVPITGIFTESVSTYLDTINFFDAPKVTGAYFSAGTTEVYPSISPSTNNAEPLIPDLLLTDPTLNPPA